MTWLMAYPSHLRRSSLRWLWVRPSRSPLCKLSSPPVLLSKCRIIFRNWKGIAVGYLLTAFFHSCKGAKKIFAWIPKGTQVEPTVWLRAGKVINHIYMVKGTRGQKTFLIQEESSFQLQMTPSLFFKISCY